MNKSRQIKEGTGHLALGNGTGRVSNFLAFSLRSGHRQQWHEVAEIPKENPNLSGLNKERTAFRMTTATGKLWGIPERKGQEIEGPNSGVKSTQMLAHPINHAYVE